jgi:branched-subunit amino acid aminotransferase/4-amino-4-deoxychorismate lyase
LVEVMPITHAMLATCEAAALTNALTGVRGVSRINGRCLVAPTAWLEALKQGLEI